MAHYRGYQREMSNFYHKLRGKFWVYKGIFSSYSEVVVIFLLCHSHALNKSSLNFLLKGN